MLDVVPVGPEFQVNSSTAYPQSWSSIAASADGDFVIAWGTDTNAAARGVYAQRYNADGERLGGEFLVQAGGILPSVGMDATGNFVIAWRGDGIQLQRYDASGIAQGAPTRVDTGAGFDPDRPSVAMNSEGDFVVAWHRFQQDASGHEIYCQRFNAAGIPQGTEFRVNTHTLDLQWFPVAAIDGDGNFVIAWESDNQDGDGRGIYAQRFDAAGNPRGNEFRANTFTTGNQLWPAVSSGAEGDFIIGWSGRGENNVAGVHAQRYDPSGAPLGSQFTVSSPGSLPSIAVRADGSFVFAWTTYQPWARGYAQVFDAQGEQIGSTFDVGRDTDVELITRVATAQDGDFTISWESEELGNENTREIFARQFTEAAVLASDFRFAAAPHRLSVTFNGDVSVGLGTEDLVVQNLTTGQSIPGSAFALAYDTATNTATFAYTGTTSGVTGMLPDGRYRATILASGTSLNDDYSTEFLFLQGDADHDGRINLQDFNILAANFGQSPRDFTQGDFNYDGVVNLDDFNVLAGRFGVVLAPAASVVNTFPSGTRAGDDEHDAEDWLT